MADEQPNVIVKVRARRATGFIRAGFHWPATDTFQRVTESQAKQLESEPLLRVERVSEADVPQGQIAPSAEDDQKNPEQKRDEMVDEEFPQLMGRPGGQQVYVGTKDRTDALAQMAATTPMPGEPVDPLAQPPAEPGGGGDAPPSPEGTPAPQQEPENQVVDLASNAFARDPLLSEAAEKTTKKRKGDQ